MTLVVRAVASGLCRSMVLSRLNCIGRVRVPRVLGLLTWWRGVPTHSKQLPERPSAKFLGGDAG